MSRARRPLQSNLKLTRRPPDLIGGTEIRERVARPRRRVYFLNPDNLKLWPQRLELPLLWKNPRMIFVNSMSDLFHEKVPTEFVERVFDVMERATIHTFQLLTKRSQRMAEFTAARYSLKAESNKRLWPRNVWAGVSVENDTYASRISDLQRVPAVTRFRRALRREVLP